MKVLSQRVREKGGGKRERWCNALSLRLVLFFYITFRIVEPQIDPVPLKKPLAEKGFMLSHVTFFLLTVLEKLLIYWVNIYWELTILLFGHWTSAVNKADKFLVLVWETVFKLRYIETNIVQTVRREKGRAKGGNFCEWI